MSFKGEGLNDNNIFFNLYKFMEFLSERYVILWKNQPGQYEVTELHTPNLGQHIKNVGHIKTVAWFNMFQGLFIYTLNNKK